MVDLAAARGAALAGRIESRSGLGKPLDVLAQHLITVAVGVGFEAQAMRDEVRRTTAYRDLSDDEWNWCLDFVTRGGAALRAYPEYRRVVEVDGVFRVVDKDIAQRHRMSIGTIMSDAAMTVQYLGGGRIGTVEESFLSRLRRGDRFLFGGKVLEFIQIREMTALVKRASSPRGAVPRWDGGRVPLSTELSHAIREKLEEAKHGELVDPELRTLAPLLELQARWSAIPATDEFLIEQFETPEGHHLFFYPMEGRLVHEGLAALFAHRIASLHPITFSLACNDYGFELLAAEPAPLAEAFEAGLLGSDNLAVDIAASLNAVEMARRQFREVARVAGLVFQGFPGQPKRARHIQANSSLIYDVFAQYDPGNMLLHQAQRQVLERQLEQSRLATALARLRGVKRLLTTPPHPTPFAFPILADRLRETLSTESITDRIQKMAVRLEKHAG
jgi:ATP-dependent Lhr-like helicase